MPAPRRKHNTPPPARKAPSPQEDAANATDNLMAEADDFMMGDGQAEQHIKEREAEYKNEIRDFYVTAKEVAASDNGMVEVRVHLLVNLAERDGDNYINLISAPRVQIPEGRGFKLYTSPSNGDCAFREAGLEPGVRPCILLMDHRSYTTQKGVTYVDDLKQFNPPGKGIGMIKQAIRDLCENLEVDPEDPDEVNAKVDVRNHVLKLTKIGSGTGSSWAFSFVSTAKPIAQKQLERIGKFFESADGGYPTREEYIKKMRGILKPSNKYLISKGGKYEIPKTNKNAGGSDKDSDVPY